ncbi:choice-of-anchor Q domain-containing protein [Chloroflexota bacterium]
MRHAAAILLVCLLALLLPAHTALPAPALANGDVLYVKPGAGGDCSSWANACDLQTALAGAEAGDEIWAAGGVYKPTTGDDRTATFQLVSGVGMYGGFAGSETSRNQREPWHWTVLAGDLNEDDELDCVNYGENSYHVVTGSGLSSDTVLDGFYVVRGNANGSHTDKTDRGGGMYISGSSPNVVQVSFEENCGNAGGGMFIDEGSPTLTQVFFGNNAALAGGGLYIYKGGPSLDLERVYFSSNTAFSGGGMLNDMSYAWLTDVTFSHNSAGTNGGGMFNTNQSHAYLWDVAFISNTADNDGGGMADNNESTPHLWHVTFIDNTAGNDGGGMHYSGVGGSEVFYVTFSGNEAGYGGGGMYNDGSHPYLANVTYSGNSAYYGGGMYNYGSSPLLRNVTFSRNTADIFGDGMYSMYHSNPELVNCILWGGGGSILGAGAPNQIDYDGTSTTSVQYSDVEGDYPGPGNIDETPLFLDALGPDNVAGTGDDNLRLQRTSPAIDAGDNALVPAGITTDLDGRSRFFDIGSVPDTGLGTPPIVDMGAYEALISVYLPLALRDSP